MSNESSIEIETQDLEIDTGTTVNISTVENDVVYDSTDGTTVEIVPNEYTISTSGIYGSGGSPTGGLPPWLTDAIKIELGSGTSGLEKLILDMKLYLDALEDGVNQEIIRMNTEDERLNALILDVKSSSENGDAAITQQLITKVTNDRALAISREAIAAEFNGDPDVQGSSNAQITQQIQVVADATSSNATSVTNLSASISGVDGKVDAEAGITETMRASVGLDADGNLDAIAAAETSIYAQIGDQKVSIDGNDIVTIDETGDYTATMSKMITGLDDSITGWVANDLGDRSDFTINADVFKVQTSDGSKLPFEIDATGDTTQITLTGNVTFKNMDIDGDSTSISGNLIQTGKVESNDGSTYIDLTNNQIKMHNTTSGFTLDSTAAGTDLDPNIEAGYIKGGTIKGTTLETTILNAATINSGTLNVDTINSGDLTTASYTNYTNSDIADGTTILSITKNATLGSALLLVSVTLYMTDYYGVSDNHEATFTLYRSLDGGSATAQDTLFYKRGTGSAINEDFICFNTSIPSGAYNSVTYSVRVYKTVDTIGGNGTMSIIQFNK